MKNKEERITIHRVLYPCKKCSINCNKNDWKNCDFYQNYISGMTRQEAIRKMCDGYFNAKDKCRTESERIEAALNTLLEDKK